MGTSRQLEKLLRGHLGDAEDPGFVELARRMRGARERGYLTAGDLEAVTRWKAVRVLPLIRANTHHRVRLCTGDAIRFRSEVGRVRALTTLRGISLPMASAVLTALNPKRYGVIDIRAWQMLHDLGLVTDNPNGRHFTVGQWLLYLGVIRVEAVKIGVSPRALERSLYRLHQSLSPGLQSRSGTMSVDRRT